MNFNRMRSKKKRDWTKSNKNSDKLNLLKTVYKLAWQYIVRQFPTQQGKNELQFCPFCAILKFRLLFLSLPGLALWVAKTHFCETVSIILDKSSVFSHFPLCNAEYRRAIILNGSCVNIIALVEYDFDVICRNRHDSTLHKEWISHPFMCCF